MSAWQLIDENTPHDRPILVTGYIYNKPERGRWAEVAEWNGQEWATEAAPLYPPTHWAEVPSMEDLP